jgi:hypothetical protein
VATDLTGRSLTTVCQAEIGRHHRPPFGAEKGVGTPTTILRNAPMGGPHQRAEKGVGSRFCCRLALPSMAQGYASMPALCQWRLRLPRAQASCGSCNAVRTQGSKPTPDLLSAPPLVRRAFSAGPPVGRAAARLA